MRNLIPSKTFLLGEYNVLLPGQRDALILCTAPYFNLEVQRSEATQLPAFHPESPAGRLIQQHTDAFHHHSFNFVDPHEGQGGMGASSAQYLLLWQWLHGQAQSLDRKKLLKDFRHHAHIKGTIQPSGADVLAQSAWGLTRVCPEQASTESMAWPFKDLSFLIVRTGFKLATHEHLSSLKLPETLPKLKNLVTTAYQGLQTSKAEQLLGSIQQYAEQLAQQGWVCPQTLELLSHINNHPDVLCSKGCGALGADTVLVFCETSQKTKLKAWLAEQQLTALADEQSLTTRN